MSIDRFSLRATIEHCMGGSYPARKGQAINAGRKTLSYIDQTLGRNETVLYRARIHSLFYIRIWVLFAIMTVAACCIAYAYPGRIGVLSSIILFAVSVVFCLNLIVPLWTLEIALTNLRVVRKQGFLSRRTHDLAVGTIEEANLRQSLLGRVLNYGTIIVRGIGDAEDLVLEGVAEPLTFRKEIASAMQSSGAAAQKAPANMQR